jgi:hypothetical protein
MLLFFAGNMRAVIIALLVGPKIVFKSISVTINVKGISKRKMNESALL